MGVLALLLGTLALQIRGDLEFTKFTAGMTVSTTL